MNDKWCESWEKNFDSTLKSLNKFKDDLKNRPRNLTDLTEKRCSLYLELLMVELEEIKINFVGSEEGIVKLEHIGT
jgi:hypothetical protein